MASGSDRVAGSAASAAVLLTSTVRLLAAVTSVPVAIAGPEPRRGLTGLALTAAVAGAELLLRDVVVRRRARAAVLLLDLAAGVGVLLLTGPGQPAAYHSLGSAALAAALLGVPGVLAALGTGLGAAMLAVWLPAGGGPPPALSAAGLPARYVLVAVLIAAVRHVLGEEFALRERLRAATERAARAEERQRLSRNLHDSATATLSGIRLSVAGLRAMVAAEAAEHPSDRLDAAARLAAQVESAASRASFETRLVVGDLRVESGNTDPTDVAVRRVAVAWQRGSAPVEVELDLAPVPEPALPVRAELLAVLREALVNVERHAGAGRVYVGLAAAGSTVRLTVADDGRGYALPADLSALTAAGHFGLAGMVERVRAAGGWLQVVERLGGGTLLTAELPSGVRARQPAVRR